jgi:capsule polysaccharide export protein KpsC/LpsZ
VCAQKYEKQLYFIDSWAKSLPADTLLYVKEHYALVGHRELSFYDELKKYPNVVLVDPWESSSDLLDNCVAVTTLTGTAGWEGMLMRKPVFMGGSIFYETAPGIIKVDDIYNNYIEKLCSWKKPKREDVIKYLSEYMSNIYEGSVYFANKQCLEKENIEKIVDSLINYLMEVNNE